jgi:hypothetical protein
MRSSVLFLIFNRPDTTRQVFEAIRTAKPPRLYIAADGPRHEREGERARCQKVRKIALDVDWECDVKTFFRDENLGCKIAVSEGISWFFDHEDEGVILEDDCLPDLSFFIFCDEMLEYYRNDSRVSMVAGTNFFQDKFGSRDSYFFSRLIQIWGWATWKRAWKNYDVKMTTWPQFKNQRGLKNIGINKKIKNYVQPSFERSYAGAVDTWDYQWSYSVISQNTVSVVPGRNLVSNLGFGPDATHTVDCNCVKSFMNTDSLDFPVMHPDFIIPSLDYDLDKIKPKINSLFTRIKRSVGL